MPKLLISYHHFTDSNFRSATVWKYFEETYPDIHFMFADWDHFNKKNLNIEKTSQLCPIKVPAYQKNISLMRIFSHFVFLLKCLLKKELYQADLVYICTPPTSSLFLFIAIKIFNRKAKIVADIVDLWPEALPFSKGKKFLFMATVGSLWVCSRNLLLLLADRVISHCKYFIQFLPQLEERTSLIPLCLEIDVPQSARRSITLETYSFLLLGSINNIFDADKCVALFLSLSKLVTKKIELHIIGGGEGLLNFKNKLTALVPSIVVFDHGKTFDTQIKNQIFNHCHFAINLYKDTTAIGVSYKSIEYMAHGLCLINSLQGDIIDIIDETALGFNLRNNVSAVANEIANMTPSKYEEYSQKSKNYYLNNYTWNAYTEKMKAALRF